MTDHTADRELLARVYHDYEAAVKAARALWPNAGEGTLREAAADFMVHVRALRTTGHPAPPARSAAPAEPIPPCPVCLGPTRDQRTSKRNTRQPDYKCSNSQCDGAVWLDRKRRVASLTT